MNESPTTEEKIISAAIVCIEKYGLQGATNRKIAQEAGVNNAAINYYFRSKDILIQRCLEITLHNAFDFEDFEQLPGDTLQEWCESVINDLIEGGLNYPGLARFHFYEVLANGKYDALAVEKLNEFVANLVKKLLSKDATLDENRLQFACMHMTSVMMMGILAPKLFTQRFGMDLSKESLRREYVKRLVRQMLS